jgi:membrane-associated phospholipid phosphatase
MRRLRRTIPALFSIAILSIGVTAADVVTDWNEILLDTIRATSTNPPRATRALAMMHLAIFNAVNGIDRTAEPYGRAHPAPPHASIDAAAAEAAYTVLAALYPAREPIFAAARDASLGAVAPGPGIRKGLDFGHACGLALLDLRAGDNSDRPEPYAPLGTFGAWQPTPPAFAPALLPNWPQVTPFAMREGSQFRPAPPPDFSSAEFAAAYNEVKELGAAASASRTPEQTEIAYFWEDGGGTATPPGHWQLIARLLSERGHLTTTENARLFALLSITQADAAIVAWDAKYAYNHLRPFTAITLDAELDGNPDTAGDPAWQALIPIPPFPSYISGHSTFSGGSSRLLALYFGSDAIPFSMASPDPDRWPLILPGVVRSWLSLSQAAEEAGQSRIYGGIHWQYDNQEGLRSGRALADYVFAQFLRPVQHARSGSPDGK